MPSMLARAALAALAGSGGRKLHDSTVGPCTHDICGRKLLAYSTAGTASDNPHGSPRIYEKDATGFAAADFYTEEKEVELDMNGHNLKLASNFETFARIDGNKLKVKATATMTALEAVNDNCELKVTPSLLQGSTNSQMTSKTFNPSTGHATVAAEVTSSVYVPPGTGAGQSGDASKGYFEVTVENPSIDDPSLGYLGVKHDVEITCQQSQIGGPATAEVNMKFGAADTDGNYPNKQPLIVRHKYTEKSSNALPLQPIDADEPITLDSKTLQYDHKAHKNLPVSIAAHSQFRTEDGQVRFPAGEWADFGQATVTGDIPATAANEATVELQCQLNQGTVDATKVSSAVKNNWYEGAQSLLKATFDGGVDIVGNTDCPGETTAGVACGRIHTATIAAETAGQESNKIGFELPLSKYYSTEPTVECSIANIQTDNTASYELTETQKDLGIPASAPNGYTLGAVKKGITVSAGGLQAADDKGEDYFGLQSQKPLFGTGNLFKIEATAAEGWSDLTETFQYKWNLEYRDSAKGVAPAGGDSATAAIAQVANADRLIALEGTGIDDVRDNLAARITAYQAQKITRPDQYGKTRHSYKITQKVKGSATDTAVERDVEFRRDDARIQLTVAAVTAGDGKVQYDGQAELASIDFPGPGEDWTSYTDSFIADSCKYCVTSGITATLATPADIENSSPQQWQFFKDFGTYEDNDASLFLKAQDGTSSACTGSGDSHAWCVTGTTGKTGSEPTAYQCSDMSVTYEIAVAKDSKDDRDSVQQVAQTITRNYLKRKPDAPAPPATQAKSDIHYRFAGSGLEPTFEATASSDDTGSIKLDFVKPTIASGADAFNCDGAYAAPGDLYQYTAPFKEVCNTNSEINIGYDVKSQFIYKSTQVETQESLVGAGTAGSKIVEHTLQRDGVDIQFEVQGKSSDFIYPLDQLSVEVSGDAISGTKTLSIVNNADVEGCQVAGDKLICTVKKYTFAAFDSDNKLHDNADCVTGTPTTGQVACPVIDVAVKATFGVPELGAAVIGSGEYLEGAFQGGVQPDDTCASVKKRELGSTSIALRVHGSSIVHDELIKVYAEEQGGSEADGAFALPFAEIAARPVLETRATGSHAEYFSKADLTDMPLRMPAIMTNLGLKFEIDSDSNGGTYDFKMLGVVDKRYNVKRCTGSSFDNCFPQDFPEGGVSPTIAADSTHVFLLKIDALDSDGNSVDPCMNKFLNDKAYGDKGIEFSVQKRGTVQAHTYRLEVQCHTATSVPTLAIRPSSGADPNPYPNGISWNQQDIDVVVSGSTLDPDIQVEVLELAGTLEEQTANSGFHTRAEIQRSDRIANPTLHFVSTLNPKCVDGTITARVVDTTDPAQQVTHSVVCPDHIFQVDGVVAGQVFDPDYYGDIFSINMQMVGRDYRLWNEKIALRKSTGGSNLETVEFYDALADDKNGNTIPLAGESAEPATLLAIPEKAQADAAQAAALGVDHLLAKQVLFQIKPGCQTENNVEVCKIRCNTIELELSSFTTQTADNAAPGTPKKFKFLIKCPRQKEAAAASDSLALDYGVALFSYGQRQMQIQLDPNPTVADLTSTAGLGQCGAGKALDVFDGTQADGVDCRLDVASVNILDGGEAGLDHFHACAKKTEDQTLWSSSVNGVDMIVGSATVARRYVHTGGTNAFDDSIFCGETKLSIHVTKSHDRYIAVSVAQADDMRFDVQVSELEWAACQTADQYSLQGEVKMLRSLGGENFNTVGLESFFRDGPDQQDGSEYFTYYKAGELTKALSRTESSGHTMVFHGPCTDVSDVNMDDSRTVTFSMKVETLGNVVHYSAASITVQIDKPESESLALGFDYADTTQDIDCAISGQPIPADCKKCITDATTGVETCTLESDYNIKLTVGVTDDEDTAFHHSFEAPRIKKGADDKCGLFGDLKVGDQDHKNVALVASDCAASYDSTDPNSICQPRCPLVSGLTDEYKAVVDGSGTLQALVQSANDNGNNAQENRVVLISVKELSGISDVSIGWIISRIESPGRRLRSVQKVYTLGADGSVATASSFGVLPAVRDTEGASVVTTEEQITLKELDADGEVIDTVVYNQTTVEHEKSGEDHTLAILGIVFGGLGSVAAIAVAFFVGCASRRDAAGVGSSFKTVAGGFSDRQPLFNRNRFAPSDF